MPLTRRYEVAYLTPLGTIDDFVRVAPATPAFEEAFSAFGRGALVATEQGAIAVEDLLPGMMIETDTQGKQPLLWVGSMMIYPGSSGLLNAEPQRLTRIATESFGLGRPVPDLVLGPYARLLYRSSKCRAALGASQAFVPVQAFADGLSVIEVTPIAPVQVFHLGFHGQQVIRANGLEIESFHPGPQLETRMDRHSFELFLSLFPHATALDGFGPMETPRLTSDEFENLGSA